MRVSQLLQIWALVAMGATAAPTGGPDPDFVNPFADSGARQKGSPSREGRSLTVVDKEGRPVSPPATTTKPKVDETQSREDRAWAGWRPSGLRAKQKVHDGILHRCPTCALPHKNPELLVAHQESEHGEGSTSSAGPGHRPKKSSNRVPFAVTERQRLDQLASQVGKPLEPFEPLERRALEPVEEVRPHRPVQCSTCNEPFRSSVLLSTHKTEEGHQKAGNSNSEIKQRLVDLPVTPWNQYGAAVRVGSKPSRAERAHQLPPTEKLVPFEEQGEPIAAGNPSQHHRLGKPIPGRLQRQHNISPGAEIPAFD
ncbi:hypothetical protein PspLS_11812 [Pyricularia sp. CBS 133598]|nr:hypothetical protein PspLS_11812 [Pyricularia sp. CBS 133598]